MVTAAEYKSYEKEPKQPFHTITKRRTGRNIVPHKGKPYSRQKGKRICRFEKKMYLCIRVQPLNKNTTTYISTGYGQHLETTLQGQ